MPSSNQTCPQIQRLTYTCAHCGEPVTLPAVCACLLSSVQRSERRVAFCVTVGGLLLLAGLLYGVLRLLCGWMG
jgi:hypothetical protein